MPSEATAIAIDGVAVAEDREERAERRLDQHPVGDVADAAADPVAERRQEARVIAEARLGVGIDAGVDIGLALGQRLEHARQHVHAGAGDEPGDHGAQRPGRLGEGARQREDAGADHPPTTIAVSCNARHLLLGRSHDVLSCVRRRVVDIAKRAQRDGPSRSNPFPIAVVGVATPASPRDPALDHRRRADQHRVRFQWWHGN